MRSTTVTITMIVARTVVSDVRREGQSPAMAFRDPETQGSTPSTLHTRHSLHSMRYHSVVVVLLCNIYQSSVFVAA